tara:strand:- start:54 stop:500 length:447 start_codon:yes stop_codon:yes gene_type:complete
MNKNISEKYNLHTDIVSLIDSYLPFKDEHKNYFSIVLNDLPQSIDTFTEYFWKQFDELPRYYARKVEIYYLNFYVSFDKKIWHEASVKTHEHCYLRDNEDETLEFSKFHLHESDNFNGDFSSEFTRYFWDLIDKNILYWKPTYYNKYD